MPLPSELRQTSRTPLLQLLRVFRQTSAGSTPALKPKKGRPCGRPLNGGESRIRTSELKENRFTVCVL